METYYIKFLEKEIPDKAIEADGFSFPDNSWEHIIFYVGPEREEKIIYTVSLEQVLSIQVAQQ